MMMQRVTGPRWKGKGFADIAAENPMSQIVKKLESSMKQSRIKAILTGSVSLLEASTELADLLNRSCIGRQIPNAEEDKHWFQLSSEETMYLQHALQSLVVVDEKGRPLNDLELWNVMKDRREAFLELYKAYVHLRGKNWVVRPGSQYGVDFVAYRHHPALVHSEYAIVVLSEGDRNGEKCSRLREWSDVQCCVRLSGSVAKKLLVFFIDRKGIDETLPSCIQRFNVDELIITRWVPEQNREECQKNDDACNSEKVPAT
ncbi:hypothetical protein HPP92_017042 [Vanilla planifolia]|uniref:tRNA-intron lyase n=1 Tax=Vanilla planifolia TaxID=51239 RepID=A0A835UUS2_VANPL|nr:hypothetical protein HPP92_017042 [Vanilla planifolia]